MTRHDHKRRGLTLLELLAAVIVFSIVAAAGVSVVRAATNSGDAWRHTARAIEMMERWRAEVGQDADQGGEPIEWMTTDQSGARWRISTSDEFSGAEPEEDSRELSVGIRHVIVERTDITGHAEVVHEAHLFIPVPDDESFGGAP